MCDCQLTRADALLRLGAVAAAAPRTAAWRAMTMPAVRLGVVG